MADATITAASVLSGANATKRKLTAGVTITRGQVVYHDPVTNKAYLAQADGTANEARAVGIALSDVAAGQDFDVQTGGYIAGCGHTKGLIYIVSGTAGAMSPHTDTTTPASSEYCTVVGVGVDATYMNIGIVIGGALA